VGAAGGSDDVGPLPQPVVDFITRHISSLLQLEALLLVFAAGQRTRTAAQLSAQTCVPVGALAGWLDEFVEDGFCARLDDKYHLPDSREVDVLLALVADCYVRRRISLGRLIVTPRYRDPNTSFSDTFRLV